MTGAGITRTIVYTYDKLYRLTDAGYSSGESYAYSYDQAGNRRSQTTLGQTTVYTYDNANRIANANTQAYTWSNTGNLLNTGVLTNTFDAANRLTSATRLTNTLAITYDGLNNRVRQTVGTTTTAFALDSASALPEVISTTNGTAYLHLPGVIVAQNAQGQRVYLLPDGLGSVRQVFSGTGVIAWRDYDPYGQVRASDPFTNTFDTSLEGWAFDSAWDIPAVLSNPPGVMRLASTQTPPYPHYATLTVKKPLSGAPGALTISTFFTVTSWVTIQFWVAYTDGSTDNIFLNGTTPAGTYSASYTTPASKTAVALYIYTAASYNFPPYQVDVDRVSVIPATPSAFNPPPYAFIGEWWEQDVRLLHLRARWYDGSSGVFLSRDTFPGFAQRPISQHPYAYSNNNPINWIDPSGYQSGPATGGGVIVTCWGIAFLIPEPFFIEEGVCALISLGVIAAIPVVAEPVADAVDEMIDISNEAWDNWVPEPENEPKPYPIPYNPQLTPTLCPPDDDNDIYHKVLTVGDGDYEYSNNLYARHLDWKITATNYGDGSNTQVYVGGFGNLAQYTNVDATRLESGAVTGKNKYNAIIFNNPHAGNGSRTASLISSFKRSASMVLAPGGEIHINVTKQLLYNYLVVAQQLGLSNNESSTVENLPTFGQTVYYAPFIPHYTTGAPMPFYEKSPDRARYLKNFVFR